MTRGAATQRTGRPSVARPAGSTAWPYAALAVYLALYGFILTHSGEGAASPTVCVFRALSGLPCPTCGGTRATLALVSGDLGLALRYNPLVAAAWLVLPVALPAAMLYRRGSRSRGRTGRQRRWVLRGALAVVIAAGLANWSYVIANLRDVEREDSRGALRAPSRSVSETARRPFR